MTYTVQFPNLGLSFHVSRVAFSIGEFPIYWYGLLIGLGMVLAMMFAFRMSNQFGLDADRMADVICIGTIGAIICARAYYVVMSPYKYDTFWDMVNLRDGGLAIYGGIIGAVLVGVLACRWRKVKPLPMLDVCAMGFLIGQSIGRWGNFANQEAFGTNTTLPWGMASEGTRSYLTAVQGTLAAQGVTVNPALPVHPTFLYESLWCALGFVLLLLYIKKRRYDGEISLMYVLWYGVGRAFIEGLRTDSLQVGALRASQVLGIVSAAIALLLLVYFRVKGRRSLARNEGVPDNGSTST